MFILRVSSQPDPDTAACSGCEAVGEATLGAVERRRSPPAAQHRRHGDATQAERGGGTARPARPTKNNPTFTTKKEKKRGLKHEASPESELTSGCGRRRGLSSHSCRTCFQKLSNVDVNNSSDMRSSAHTYVRSRTLLQQESVFEQQRKNN